MRFAKDQIPDHFYEVRRIFQRKGAYSRFKALLQDIGALQLWYDFERAEQAEAIREWCKENNIELEE